MILLDTCALIWWTLDPVRLSQKARKKIDQTLPDSTIFVSSISLWEIGIKIKNKKLDLGMSCEKYVEELNKIGNLEILSVDVKIWMANLKLNWVHKDPCDRTIVATASLGDLPLLTADKEISRFYKKTCW